MTVVSAQGLDVSNFQGQFPWVQVKAGYPALAFGLFKVTEGTGFTDADAGWNAAETAKAKLHRGMYHFFHPNLGAIPQADFFAAEVKKLGVTGTDMLWLDYEVADGVSPAAAAAVASGFLNHLRTLFPHNPLGVYTYVNFVKEGYCAGLGKWPLWLAYPALTSPLPPPPWVAWTFWQWGQRNGIDADAFNGTAADLDKWIGSFTPVDPPPPPPSSPVKLQADGVHSFGSLLDAHHTTLSRSLYLMAKDPNSTTGYGRMQTAFIDANHDRLWTAIPPKGMTYWAG